MKQATFSRQAAKSQTGFTILELMIATSIFSIILLVAAAGILRFTHSYLKGVNTTKTQNAARAVIGEVAQKVQFSTAASPLLGSVTPGNAQGYCFDQTLYSFKIGQQVTAGPSAQHGLVRSQGASCSGATPVVPSGSLAADQQELLGDHMRLTNLTLTPGSDGRTYQVDVTVVYGDIGMLRDQNNAQPTSDWSRIHCVNDNGGAFCAVSHLSTTVVRRIGV